MQGSKTITCCPSSTPQKSSSNYLYCAHYSPSWDKTDNSHTATYNAESPNHVWVESDNTAHTPAPNDSNYYLNNPAPQSTLYSRSCPYICSSHNCSWLSLGNSSIWGLIDGAGGIRRFVRTRPGWCWSRSCPRSMSTSLGIARLCGSRFLQRGRMPYGLRWIFIISEWCRSFVKISSFIRQLRSTHSKSASLAHTPQTPTIASPQESTPPKPSNPGSNDTQLAASNSA